jgi:transmembrane sensor
MSGADPRAQAADDAAMWMARRQERDVSQDPRFTAWLAASEDNARAWADAERLWASFDAAPDPLLAAMRDVALQARPVRRLPLPFLGAIAAIAAALILAIGLTWHGAGNLFVGREAAVAPAHYATNIGERATLTLADNSTLTLDSGSRIDVTMAKHRRDIRLVRGEAYFAVAHDASRPFVVSVGDETVTALGTEFDILAHVDGMRVVLVKGSVATVAGGVTTRLSPGQMIDTGRSGDGRPHDAEATTLLAWREGYLVFRATPLADAVAQMNRRSRNQIVIADPALSALPVSGRFQTGDNARFARAIAEIYSLEVSRQSNGDIVIKSQSEKRHRPA